MTSSLSFLMLFIVRAIIFFSLLAKQVLEMLFKNDLS